MTIKAIPGKCYKCGQRASKLFEHPTGRPVMVCEDCFEQGLKEWDVRKEDWKMVKESALIKDYLQG